MFNVIELQTGWKADLMIRKDRPFDVEEFLRRQPGDTMGLRLPIATAEDVILSKLEWSRESRSQVQWRDAVTVAAVQWEALDTSYLRRWAAELGVASDLEELLEEADKRQGTEW